MTEREKFAKEYSLHAGIPVESVGQRNHVATLIHRLSSTGLTSGVSVRKIKSKVVATKYLKQSLCLLS